MQQSPFHTLKSYEFLLISGNMASSRFTQCGFYLYLETNFLERTSWQYQYFQDSSKEQGVFIG